MIHTLSVRFDTRLGPIRPLHGVNNGPLTYGSLTDVTQYFIDATIPLVRLHDVNWPHPREVDIHTIFPDFSRDPEDPTSYDFARTDVYLKSVLETGARIVYRLGESIEHTARKFYVHPPADFEKWAQVCIGIIRHYNEGWADGFEYNIEYWEIWNEPEHLPNTPPDKNPMWSGTYQQFFELYQVASTRLKARFPRLKIGGYGSTSVNPEFAVQFLDYAQEHGLTLDFYSWHTYFSRFETVWDNALEVRRTLDTHGYAEAESHFNEWNYMPLLPSDSPVLGRGNEEATQRLFQRIKGEEGASMVAAMLILLQDLPIDEANFYDSSPTAFWGLFTPYGVPEKSYFAFRAFAEVYQLGQRVLTPEVNLQADLHALASLSEDKNRATVLLSHVRATKAQVQLALEGLTESDYTYELLRVDHTHTYGSVGKGHLSPGEPLHIDFDGYGFVLVRLERRTE